MKDATATFDRKFGSELITQIPQEPGIYRFWDEAGQILYVGKAKNLRRRLSQYRQADSRKKKFRRTRRILSDAHRLDWQTLPNHLEACLAEVRAIQDLKPRMNIAAAFSDRYPYLGILQEGGRIVCIYTTRPEDFPEAALHGAYRSPLVCREGFFHLVLLLEFLGHREMQARSAQKKGSIQIPFRGLSPQWLSQINDFLRGSNPNLLQELALTLLEDRNARHHAERVQSSLKSLRTFWRSEPRPLAAAIAATAYTGPYPIPQKERDPLFLAHKVPLD